MHDVSECCKPVSLCALQLGDCAVVGIGDLVGAMGKVSLYITVLSLSHLSLNLRCSPLRPCAAVDVVEISDRVGEIGEVYAVKPLAVLAMIDDGELDWKIVAIRADDPKAALVNDVEDVEKVFPVSMHLLHNREATSHK